MTTVIIDNPDPRKLQLITLKHALKLEILGLKRRGRSAYAILKGLGYKGSRAKVLEAVTADVAAMLDGK